MEHVQLNRLLVGKIFEDARNEYKENVEFRIIEEDGKANAISTEMKKNRVNVIVRNGIITEVLGMY